MSTENAALSLHEVFRQIPDPRGRRGTVYSLASVLTLVATAMLCGRRNLAAIAEWGRHCNPLPLDLGFTRRTRDGSVYRTPCTSELHTPLAAPPAAAFEAALTRWILAQGVTDLERRVGRSAARPCGVARAICSRASTLLAAYCWDVEAVLAQLAVPGKTNEHKTALELLKLIPLEGTLIIGAAAFTKGDRCAAVIAGEGGTS